MFVVLALAADAWRYPAFWSVTRMHGPIETAQSSGLEYPKLCGERFQ
jgi:hypothetical protein